jgi:hypothetical protein
MTFQKVVHSAQTAANSREDGISTLPQHSPKTAACRCLIAHHTTSPPHSCAVYVPEASALSMSKNTYPKAKLALFSSAGYCSTF